MADGVGFEPTVRLHARRFSRPLPSTARPPIPLRTNYAAGLCISSVDARGLSPSCLGPRRLSCSKCPLHEFSDYDGPYRASPAARHRGKGAARGRPVEHLDLAGRKRLNFRRTPHRPLLRQRAAPGVDLADEFKSRTSWLTWAIPCGAAVSNESRSTSPNRSTRRRILPDSFRAPTIGLMPVYCSAISR